MAYNLQNIRTLLTEGFDIDELRRFCYDHPGFKIAYKKLSPEMGQDKVIDRLIVHAEQTLQLEALLAWAKEQNPARYEQHRPYYIDSPTSLKNVVDYLRSLGWQKSLFFIAAIVIISFGSLYYIFYIRNSSNISATPTPSLSQTSDNPKEVVLASATATEQIQVEAVQPPDQISNTTILKATATYNLSTDIPLPTESPTGTSTSTPNPIPSRLAQINPQETVPLTVTVASTSTFITGSLTVNVSGLNVRAGPGTQYSQIGQLSRGDQFEIIGQINSAEGIWWQINFPSSLGGLGWVSGNFDYVTPHNTDVVPIVTAPPLPTIAASTLTPLLQENQEVSSTFASAFVPAPTLVQHDGKYFIWEWDELETVRNENWYFDVKIFPSVNANEPYETLVASLKSKDADGKWRFEGKTNLRCGSYWVVQIARSDSNGNFLDHLSSESDRLPIGGSCDSDNHSTTGGGGI